MSGGEKLVNAAGQVSNHMGAILQLFHAGARITVIVRPTASNDDGARDFLMTDDDLSEVVSLIRRRQNASEPSA